MSESTNSTANAQQTLLNVVCDNCSTGYQVSAMNFKDSYKHKFSCENCGESWVEYLDIPIWEELRVPILAMQQRAEAEKKARLQKEREAAKAAEEAAKAAEEAARLAEEEAAKAAEEAARLAEEEAAKAAEEAARLAEEEAATQEPTQKPSVTENASEEDSSADTQATEEKSQKKTDKENNKTDADPPKGVKKFLVYLNPVTWGQFSVIPVAIALVLVLAVIIGSGSYFYALRTSIVQQNPLAAGAYAATGIQVSPVDGFHVKIDRIERKDIIVPGERTEYEYLLRAKILNLSGTEHRVPFARFSALDIEGNGLSSWDVNLTGRVLQHGGEVNLVVQIPENMIGNERVDTFAIRLISKLEREILGESPLLENMSTI